MQVCGKENRHDGFAGNHTKVTFCDSWNEFLDFKFHELLAGNGIHGQPQTVTKSPANFIIERVNLNISE